MAYKIINDHVILDSDLMPKVSYQRPTRKCNETNVGYQNQLVELSSTLDVVNSTFFFDTPKLWNQKVSTLQANAPSVDAFKQHFKRN